MPTTWKDVAVLDIPVSVHIAVAECAFASFESVVVFLLSFTFLSECFIFDVDGFGFCFLFKSRGFAMFNSAIVTENLFKSVVVLFRDTEQ